MDQFLTLLSKYTSLLLPVAGLAVLIILIMILLNVLKTLKKLPGTVDNVDSILANVNQSIDKLQGPLDAVAGVSKSVDTANSALNTVIGFIAHQFIKNYSLIKEIIVGLFSSKKKSSKSAESTDETSPKE